LNGWHEPTQDWLRSHVGQRVEVLSLKHDYREAVNVRKFGDRFFLMRPRARNRALAVEHFVVREYQARPTVGWLEESTESMLSYTGQRGQVYFRPFDPCPVCDKTLPDGRSKTVLECVSCGHRVLRVPEKKP
jgi:hypothetical protein